MSTPGTERVEALQPVPIHLASIGPNVKLGGGGKKERRTAFYTITLTQINDPEQLLPASDEREIAWIQPLDDNVNISDNGSSAVAGSGTIVPKGNNQPYPVQHSGAVYVSVPVLAGASSRITVTAVYLARDLT
jgi:hypothetical protein